MPQNNISDNSNKNLLNSFRNVKPYYQNIELSVNILELMNNFSIVQAREFITKYFVCGGKSEIFDLSFIEEYSLKGKHQHSVSLYLLGEHLKKLIETQLKNILNKITDYKCENNQDLFSYIWFLTCLFHDSASAIEYSTEKFSRGNNLDLDFYLGEHNIRYNVFEHKWKKDKPFIYSQNLVENYFKYRIEHSSKIDHGILAGHLLYDRLRSNYDKNYNECKEKCKTDNFYNSCVYKKTCKTIKYKHFTFKDLNWADWHHDYYAYATHSIIGHNIWLAQDKEDKCTYEKYGLTPLILPKAKKISIKEQPLLFYLGLLDTLEPLKRFLNTEGTNANEILENMNISVVNDNQIKIEISNSIKVQNENNYKKWIDSIYSLKHWLKINIFPEKKEDVVMEIKLIL